MKIYYLLYVLNDFERDFFFKTIKNIDNIENIDNLIKNNYYRVWYSYDNKVITNNSIILEAWIFIKYIWQKYDIKPDNITWINKENLVILNESLFIQKLDWLEEIKNDWKSLFLTSRYDFYNPFWFLWEKISKINEKFPKLLYPNKKLNNYYRSNDKIWFIMNIYEKREELIWDFMISLFKFKSANDIKWILELRKNKTGKDNLVLKLSWWSDNWKHIQLINIDEYLNRHDLIEYIQLKYINSINEYWSNIYFIDYYNIEIEYRLYLSRDKKSWKYKLYSLKNKINLTDKESLYSKESFSTWNNIKVKWELWNQKYIPKNILNYWKMVLDKNNIDISVIELVKTKDWNTRFLEINTLWWSMMFEWQDEKNIVKRIDSLWNNVIEKK